MPRASRTLCAAVFLAFPSAALADWYSGDPYAAQKSWPQFTDCYSPANGGGTELALTYDNFAWVPGGGGGVVDIVGGHFHSFGSHGGSTIDLAYWEIRTGMAHNVGGSIVAFGSGTITPYLTGFVQGGAPVWGVSVDVPNFALPAGNYWFGLAIGTTSLNPADVGWFVASTTGAGGIGGPLGDNTSIYYQIYGATVNWDYTDSATVNPGFTGLDPSYWIREAPSPSAPAALALAALVAARRRRS